MLRMQLNPYEFLLFSHLILGITFIVVTILIIIYIIRRIRLQSLPEDIIPTDPDEILLKLGVYGVMDLKYFKNVPQELIEEYLDFLKSHPKKRFIDIDGVEWEYITSGTGERVLLVLPGGNRRPFLGYKFAQRLEQEFKIISPSYPSIESIANLVAGIYQILINEKAKNVFVLGSSFGGIIAQAFFYHHSDMVEKMIIGNTGTLKRDPREKYNFEKRMKRALKLINFFPTSFSKRTIKKSLGKLIIASEQERTIYIALLNYYISARAHDKRAIACHFENLLDFSQNFQFDDEFRRRISPKLLIITALGDAGVSPDAKMLLKATYPGAKYYEFKEGGHTPALLLMDEYLNLIREFCTSSF
ncbi:MAG: alpha/beta hydrolase [Candidatus Lokiarchaeota archaeon]|nr:alpha/beta hydrolase [Candidatus Lokiarchaeota archaeon]